MLGNFWKRFTDLMPQSPLLVGTIREAYAGNVFWVELLGGGLVHVKADKAYSKGAKVFVKDGVITGEAPDLKQVEIEI